MTGMTEQEMEAQEAALGGDVRSAVRVSRGARRRTSDTARSAKPITRRELRTGRRVCSTCKNRSVRVTTRRTRSYGGGWDTFEKCETDGCGYAEVFV